MQKFYLTTPLYYVNDKPHIGHAYTTILADVICRFKTQQGLDVYFLTGTDEHGQKIQEAAKKNNLSPIEHVEKYYKRFELLWKKLNINYNNFIRTTESRHIERVKEALMDLYSRDEIYLHEYEGLYSVSEERFITQREADEGSFRQIKKIKEKNYFFRMSKYQKKLLDHINNNPDFIKPQSRKNEILGFLNKPLEDLCITRPKSRLSWGIEVPFDKEYVTYVWFDALLNYITAIGWGKDKNSFNKWWPANYHLMAKDIITTHAVYWPTMLMALKVSLPKTIMAHGWWLFESKKMSKSLGNIINPLDIIDQYGVDELRYFLMRDMVLGSDASFSFDNFVKRYNSDLANDYGNLFNRITILIKKYFNGNIPEPGEYDNVDLEIIKFVREFPAQVNNNFDDLMIDKAIEKIFTMLRKVNGYLERKAPWKLVKNNSSPKSEAATTLFLSANILRVGTHLLVPIMPIKTKLILQSLGAQDIDPNKYAFDLLKPGSKIGSMESPFPRIDKKI
tara:strand:- start:3514 stop:5031 length:1518 start_codon:yes stop_codon:yes gene_type:complete